MYLGRYFPFVGSVRQVAIFGFWNSSLIWQESFFPLGGGRLGRDVRLAEVRDERMTEGVEVGISPRCSLLGIPDMNSLGLSFPKEYVERSWLGN